MPRFQPKFLDIGPLINDAAKVRFQGDLAVYVCLEHELISPEDLELIRVIRSAESLEDFTNKFMDECFTMRDLKEFLAHYTEAIRDCVGKANCGCVYHAEDGIPCEHDLELAGI